MILELFAELEDQNLSKSVYVWADCNLSTVDFLQGMENELKEIAKKNNFGIVGCLKAIGNEETGKYDFAKITKSKPEFYSKQFKTLNFLVNTIKADTYVYAIPIIFEKENVYPRRLEEFAKRLIQINKNLPLRTNILRIRKYSPVEKNIQKAYEEGRKLPQYTGKNFDQWYNNFIEKQKAVTKIWYQNILPKFYTVNDMSKYRCKIPLH